MRPEPVTPFWLTAFLDFPPDTFDAAVAFWAAVTSYAVSPPSGPTGEFATLVPLDGNDYLRVQRVGDAVARIHLDIHVDDVSAAADSAAELGAVRVAGPWEDVRVMTSPGGLTFCFVTHPAGVPPQTTTWTTDRRQRHSRVYQVCLDIPSAAYDVEVAFWSGILRGEASTIERRPEFAWLRRRGGWALDVLTQRLREVGGPVRAHLDLGSTERSAEVGHHLANGARLVRVEEFWTVLRDPAGLSYCVTDRDPRSGTLVSDAPPRVTP